MNTLMITTPGMGKTYLVKQLKAAKTLAFDFDVKGTKPIGLDAQALCSCRRANTAFVNHTFEAGYVLGTSWPGAIDFNELNKNIEVVFVLPVSNAITGCLLRIAARQPGSAFLMEMLDHFGDVADKVLADYNSAVAAGCKATLVKICRPDWTLHTLYKYGVDYMQRQYEIECDLYDHIPFRNVICKVTGLPINHINTARFLDHITPYLAERIILSLDCHTLRELNISFCYPEGYCSRASFNDVLSSLEEGEAITEINELSWHTYTINIRRKIESDEMGDWYTERFVMLCTRGDDFYA
jgi:hypothetical protein